MFSGTGHPSHDRSIFGMLWHRWKGLSPQCMAESASSSPSEGAQTRATRKQQGEATGLRNGCSNTCHAKPCAPGRPRGLDVALVQAVGVGLGHGVAEGGVLRNRHIVGPHLEAIRNRAVAGRVGRIAGVANGDEGQARQARPGAAADRAAHVEQVGPGVCGRRHQGHRQ